MLATDPHKKLTPRQAAERIGLAPAHLANLRSRGTGPAFLKLGRKVMYALGDVDAWLASKRMTQTKTQQAKGRRRAPADAARPAA